MKTLFITGAEGFVGLHLLEHFRQRGFEVVAGVRNRARKLNLEKRFGKALVCDVADAINVARAIASVNPDGVIHLAGPSNPDTAAEDPLASYQCIVTAWANVLDAVRRAVPRGRVLLISAADAYGDAGRDERPLNETTQLRPITTFGALKAAAESIAATFFHNYHLNVTIARPFPHIGPGLPDQSYFGAVARELADWDPQAHGPALKVPHLNMKRDILHIQDVVEAYERLLVDGKPGETYNVCTGQCYTAHHAMETLIRAAGCQVSLADLPVDGQTNIPCLIGDNTKICNELGWRPTQTLEQACRDLVRSFQQTSTPTTTASATPH